jgi:hypothetical protein
MNIVHVRDTMKLVHKEGRIDSQRVHALLRWQSLQEKLVVRRRQKWVHGRVAGLWLWNVVR